MLSVSPCSFPMATLKCDTILTEGLSSYLSLSLPNSPPLSLSPSKERAERARAPITGNVRVSECVGAEWNNKAYHAQTRRPRAGGRGRASSSRLPLRLPASECAGSGRRKLRHSWRPVSQSVSQSVSARGSLVPSSLVSRCSSRPLQRTTDRDRCP